MLNWWEGIEKKLLARHLIIRRYIGVYTTRYPGSNGNSKSKEEDNSEVSF